MTASLYALALELVALFGFLCILLNVLLPALAFVLRFVTVDVPREWRKWQLHRAQQHELRRLQWSVDVLTRKKQADEQETRRRARTASAQKRQQAEEDEDVDSVRAGSKVENTPKSQRHRLSIYSTAKKPAASRRTRDEEEL